MARRQTPQRFFFATPSIESSFSVGLTPLALDLSALGLRISLFDFFWPLAMVFILGVSVRRAAEGRAQGTRGLQYQEEPRRAWAPGWARWRRTQISMMRHDCKVRCTYPPPNLPHPAVPTHPKVNLSDTSVP